MEDHRRHLNELTDIELTARTREGDQSAFDALLFRYMPVIRSRAGRYAGIAGADREDFVQEGMLALFRAARGYQEARQTEFGAYASRSIHNAMLTLIKKNRKTAGDIVSIEQMGEEYLSGRLARPPATPEDDVILSEYGSSRQRKIMALLSDFEQRVLDLYLGGHTYQQIAASLNTSSKAIDNALQRVKRKLRPVG